MVALNKKRNSDIANQGGSAPRGSSRVLMGASSQWATSNAAARSNFPIGYPADETHNPIEAAAHMAKLSGGQADESVSERGDVPVHPGLSPGLFRTARDANYKAPDGETPTSFTPLNDATANDGRMTSPGGRHRGESPETLKQTRGDYRP